MIQVATWSALEDRVPASALVEDVDLVVVRTGSTVSVHYGRCLHRGALLSDGHVDGDNLICGLHGWDYRVDTGVSAYNNKEALTKFDATIDLAADAVLVDETQVAAWAKQPPSPTSATHTSACTRIPTGRPRRARTRPSSASPARGSRSSVTTGR